MSDMDERFYSLQCSVVRGYVNTGPNLYTDTLALLNLLSALANEENQ